MALIILNSHFTYFLKEIHAGKAYSECFAISLAILFTVRPVPTYLQPILSKMKSAVAPLYLMSCNNVLILRKIGGLTRKRFR